jgi:hypothetical protein
MGPCSFVRNLRRVKSDGVVVNGVLVGGDGVGGDIVMVENKK